MFKNLDGEVFGIFSRQNEVVEIALTHGFRSISVDLGDMQNRADAFDEFFATRFIQSARESFDPFQVGEFKLPVDVSASEEVFNKQMARLETCCNLAKVIDAKRCYTTVAPGSATLAYKENFELHRERLGLVADKLNESGISLGIGIDACASSRKNFENDFIFQAEPVLTLIKTISRPNVGLSLDVWNWVVGGGGVEQLQELTADQIINVRLADLPVGVSMDDLVPTQRLLPGTTDSTVCLDMVKALKEKGYTGPVTPTPALVQFSGTPRESMVARTRESIDTILEKAGIEFFKPIFAVEEEAAPAPAAAEGEGEAKVDAESKVDAEANGEAAKATPAT